MIRLPPSPLAGGLEMPLPGWDSARRIEDAVLTGTLAETDLDARVLEMLQLVERVTGAGAAGAAGAHDVADVETTHHALARRAAAEGAVLLRNDGVLPLARGTRVALLGEYADQPRYQGAGSSLVNPTRLTSLRGAAQALVAEGTIELVGATGAAADADPEVIVLAMAIPPEHESEGLDRPHLRLPEDQIVQLRQAAASGVPVIVTLAGGGLVEMPWLDDCATLVHGYLGGQAGGEAMWDVLTGQVDPGGRLAESLPESYPVPSQGPQAVYAEGRHLGYRAGTGSPAFGAGLSYTTFAYSELEVSQDAAAVTVTNTGARSGSEVVQMYVRRELLELKGFTKVRLEPGESARVTLPFTERTFRSFDVASGSWVVVAGEYEVLVGHDSNDLALSATVVRDGVTGPVVGQTSTSGPGNTSPAGTTPGSTVPSDPEPDTEPADWGVPPFTENTPLDQAVHSPSRLVRAIVGELLRRRDRSMGAGHPDLEVLIHRAGPVPGATQDDPASEGNGGAAAARRRRPRARRTSPGRLGLRARNGGEPSDGPEVPTRGRRGAPVDRLPTAATGAHATGATHRSCDSHRKVAGASYDCSTERDPVTPSASRIVSRW